MAKKNLQKAMDARIEHVYRRTCSGIAIDIMDIEKVFVSGRAAIASGADDVALGTVLRETASKLAAQV